MAYPTYKGNGYLVTDPQGIIGQNESDTNVGRYIVNVAEYYYKQGCYENNGKYDACITDFIKEYRGSSNPKYEAYCTMFIYFLLNKAKECLGIENPFPTQSDKVFDTYTNKTDVIWGNAYRANKWLFENKSNLNNDKPLPACSYYRYSASSGSSGHWGLVIKVTKDGWYGIEGNIKLDNNEGVGLWFYPNSDIVTGNQNGFSFYRLDNVSPKTDKDYSYNGSTCEEIIKVRKEPKYPNCMITRQELLNNYSKELVDTMDKFFSGSPQRYVKIENTSAPQLAVNENMGSAKYTRMEMLSFQRDIQKAGIYPLDFMWTDPTQTKARFWLEYWGQKDFYELNGKCYVQDDTVVKEEEKDESKDPSDKTTTTDEGSVSTYTEKKKECKTVLFSVPTSSQVKHWNTALRDGMWWADVIGDVDVDYGLRNGSATFYGGKRFTGSNNQDLKDNYTGIGFTKLENGTPVYIVNKYHKFAYNVLFPENAKSDDASLVGQNPAIIEVYDTNLPKYSNKYFRESSFFAKPFNDLSNLGGAENNIYGNDKIDLYLHLKDQNKRLTFNGSIVSNVKNIMSGFWGHTEEGHNILGTKRDIDYLPLKTFLKTCENNDVANSSIVIVISDTDFKAIGDEKTFELLGGMIKMATQFVPGLNAVAGQAIDVGLSFVTQLRKSNGDWSRAGKQWGIENLQYLTDALGEAAQYVAPKEMAWVSKQYKEGEKIVTEYTDWFKKAERSAYNLLNEGSNNWVKNVNAAASFVGLDRTSFEKITNQFNSLVNIPTDLTKVLSGLKLEDVSKTAFHLESYLMIDKLRKTLESESLISSIIDSDSLTDVPLMRKLFSTGTADTILQMLPKSEMLSRNLVKLIHPSDFNKSDKTSAWIAVAMGQKPPKELLIDYEIDALTKTALVQFQNGLQFIMPPSIDKELAECYKVEIQQRLEQADEDFVVCKDGWTYDFDAKKCKRDNLFIGYEEDKTTTGGWGNTEEVVSGECPDGFLMYNGKCYPKSSFSCPDGYTFDEKIMKCVPVIDINKTPDDPYGNPKNPYEDPYKITDDCVKEKEVLSKKIKDLEELYNSEKNRVTMYMKAFRDCESKYNLITASDKDSSTFINKISNLEIIIDSLKKDLDYTSKELEKCRNELITCNNKQQVENLSKKCEDDLKKIVLERDKLIYELQSSNKEIERLKIENNNLKTSTDNSNVDVQKIVTERNNYFNDLQVVIKKYNEKVTENNSLTNEIKTLKEKITVLENRKVEIVEKIKYIEKENPEDEETINKLIEEYNKQVYEINDYKQKLKVCENNPIETPPIEKTPITNVTTGECNDCDKAKIPSFVEKIERISYGVPEHHNHFEECEEC